MKQQTWRAGEAALRSLRRESKKLEVVRARQHELIHQAHGAGVPLRTIAEAANVAHETVRNIMRGKHVKHVKKPRGDN